MPRDFVTPNPQTISSLLTMFFGDGLNVTEIEAADLSDRHVATFVSDEGELVALCACDRPLVAYAGAALSMIPADVANAMVVGGDLTEAILGNFHEVMNICSKLLMSDGSAHLRLDKTLSPEQSAEVITNLEENSAQVVAFGIDIPGYGKGSLTFLIT